MSDTIRGDLNASFLYNRWADARISAAIRDLGPVQFHREPAPGWSSIGSTFFHLVVAGRSSLRAC